MVERLDGLDEDSATAPNGADLKQAPGPTGKRLTGQTVRFASASTPGDTGTLSPKPLDALEKHLDSLESEPSNGLGHEVRAKARQALQCLLEGNRRFCQGRFERCKPDLELLQELRQEEEPCAVVLSCSDSRVPPELVFDQGLGDIYVLLGARLVVVLGHSRCMTVAGAVQKWAQHPDRQAPPAAVAAMGGLKPAPDVRRTSSDGSGSAPVTKVAGSTTPRSPFAAAAAAPAVTPGRIVPSTAPKAPGGLLSRLCSCGRPAADGGGDEGHEEGGSGRGGREAAAAHAASASPASPTPAHSVSARSGSGPRGMERLSMNPIGTIMGAIQTAVEHVAHSGDGLKHVVTQLGKGGEPEEVGGYRLQSQDSLGITRARLARQRENARMALLNQINSMQGVEEVITENIVVSAKAVLKGLCATGLSKCMDIGTVREVEVVAAKYELDSGAVAVIKRAWCSARGSYFYE